MTIEIEGNWDKGFAYDVHTLESVYLGPDEFGHKRFETTRSIMGELVYKLKYKNDKSVTKYIVDLLDKFKGIAKFDAIIPAPHSKQNRPYQPVDEIAIELGKRRNVDVLTGFLEKKEGTKELKDISNLEDRIQGLKEVTFISSEKNISGQKVLLLDDLYRSGATLSVSTDLLYEQAKVSSVSILTMTKTKSNR
jgi:predicted amidophosphoribosyltransferase